MVNVSAVDDPLGLMHLAAPCLAKHEPGFSHVFSFTSRGQELNSDCFLAFKLHVGPNK